MSLREMHEQQKQSSPREQLQELNRQSRTELENSLLKEALAMSSENCEELMKQSNQEQVRAEQNRQRDAEQSGKSQQQYIIEALTQKQVVNLDGLKEIYPELKRQGNNLNQIAFPGKQFSGYEFLAYYYVSWVIAEPEHLLDTGLPFHKAYSMARQMWEKRK